MTIRRASMIVIASLATLVPAQAAAPPVPKTPKELVAMLAAQPPAPRDALVFGDGDHNGQVDFNDITATLANWLAGVALGPGESPPPPPALLTAWAQQRVVKIHSMAIENLESPEYTIIVVRGGAGEIAAELGVGPRTIGGMRGLDWPGGWPPWPPPGGALEELMEVWAAHVGEWNQEQVEAAAQAVINQLLAQRAAAQRKAKP